MGGVRENLDETHETKASFIKKHTALLIKLAMCPTVVKFVTLIPLATSNVTRPNGEPAVT